MSVNEITTATATASALVAYLGEPNEAQKATLEKIAARQKESAASETVEVVVSPQEAANRLEAIGFKGAAAALRGEVPQSDKRARILIQALRHDNVPSDLKGTTGKPGVIRLAITAAWDEFNSSQAGKQSAQEEPIVQPQLRLNSKEGKEALIAEFLAAEVVEQAGGPSVSEALTEAAFRAQSALDEMAKAEAEAKEKAAEALKAAAAKAEAKAAEAAAKAKADRSLGTKLLKNLDAKLAAKAKAARQEAAAALRAVGDVNLAAAVVGDGTVSFEEAICLLEKACEASFSLTTPMGPYWVGFRAALDAAWEAKRKESAYRARNFRARNGGATGNKGK